MLKSTQCETYYIVELILTQRTHTHTHTHTHTEVNICVAVHGFHIKYKSFYILNVL
jgi:hypothetical protein